MSRKSSFLLAALLCLLAPGFVFAQSFDGPPSGPGGPDPMQGPGFGPPPMEHAFHDHFGRWWREPDLAQQLGLTDQQKKQMDDIFLQHRLKLIDLNANLEKQETLLRPMIEADQPDEAKILAQIDAVAQARADLEKANARMLFDIRKTLTPDQWQKLKTMREEHRPDKRMMRDGRRGPGGPGGPGGPQMWRKHRMSPPNGSAPAPGSAPPPAPSQTPQPPSDNQ
ncbi:MAG TPA: Spy/CpxP family protein refolding chaperone [Acidobacteriaceae bacterium]|nr:Spy/CpxP family protein refolding chaperone [Acidobacteriaceae bacterium]